MGRSPLIQLLCHLPLHFSLALCRAHVLKGCGCWWCVSHVCATQCRRNPVPRSGAALPLCRAVVPDLCGTRDRCASENLTPGDLRWSWGGDATGERPQVQMKLGVLACCSPPLATARGGGDRWCREVSSLIRRPGILRSVQGRPAASCATPGWRPLAALQTTATRLRHCARSAFSV